MQFSTITAALALFASSTISSPIAKREYAVTDLDILQYALTLEHLENVFYKKAVTTMNEQMFLTANYTAEYYQNLLYIVHDEEQHVMALTAAITKAGATPVAACEYDFPFTDPKSFVSLASVLEGVGVSAYLGAAGLIQSKAYLGVAGSILVTESLHQSVQRFNLGEVAPASPYGTALDINDVYTMAAAFITKCPTGNPMLNAMAFPTLTPTQGTPTAPGIPFTFTVKGAIPSSFFVTFVSGLDITSVTGTVVDGMISAVVPATAMGQSYVFITNVATNTTVTDSMVLFGPTAIEVTPASPDFNVTYY